MLSGRRRANADHPSVVPPPPQINAAKAYPGITSLADTQNSIERSTGSENQLVLGEGTYAFRDQVRIAFPPPHPSDVPVVNTNPLAITQTPPTAGTKLSLVVIASRPKPIHNLYRLPSASDSRLHGHTESISEDKPYPSRPHNDGESVSESNGTGTPPNNSGASRFGLDNPALAAVPAEKTKDGSKKKKPKNNIVKSNSSFISRVIPHDSLHKRLNERSPYGILAFANVGRAVQWLDLAAENKVDNLTKLLFTKAHVLCHDINQVTKAPNNIEVLFGFNTSDIIWYEPTSQKYARINKNGIINNTAVSSINWLPGSDHLFVASHMDGSIIVYDKDKEDAAFVPEDAPAPSDGSKRPITAATMQIKKSVQSRNQRTNPVSYWQMGWDKINRIAFSPDGTHLAAVTENGRLKIIDIVREKLLDVFRSYYGALLSVTWSPDGRYILTGGQDDLVSIWSFADGMLVARCAGHSNFVTDVKFDPWRCDERSYRFGSVGEDCKLLLWDFSVGMLGRPRALSLRQRTTSIASGMAASDRRKESGATGSVLLSPRRTASRSNLGGASGGEDEEVPDDEDVGAEDHVVQHGVDSRASTASLPPVMAKVVGPQPLSWLGFEEDCIMAVSEDGYIRTWDRPSDAVPEE